MTLGQVAFETWAANINYLSTWDELPGHLKAAWELAALRVAITASERVSLN